MAKAMSGRVPRKLTDDNFSGDMENDFLKCGFASAKGWQPIQENAHLCIIDYDVNVSLFGVFEGNGGPEVAFCAAEKMPELIRNDYYSNGDYGEALKKAFLDFDQFLLTGDGFKRMRLHHGPIKGKNNRGSDESLNEKLSDQTLFGYASGADAMVVLVVDGRRVYMAHVGSTGCVISYKAGPPKPYVFATQQHIPKNKPELSKIYRASGITTEKVLESRCLGYHLYKNNLMLPSCKQLVIPTPDIGLQYIEPSKGYYILIACDGIWKSISKYVAAQTVYQCLDMPEMNMSSICQYLIKKCWSPIGNTYISHDVENMTCILVYCKPPAPVFCIPDKCGDAFDALKL